MRAFRRRAALCRNGELADEKDDGPARSSRGGKKPPHDHSDERDIVHASLRILARDLKRLAKSPVALLVTLGVCLIPSAYAWLNILANWDPYENTGTVPVAVAVEDEGAEVPGLGELNAGELVRERLEENHQLGWTFVDQDAALEGVRSGRYYAAFVIPAD